MKKIERLFHQIINTPSDRYILSANHSTALFKATL
jgi:hypothetical protein